MCSNTEAYAACCWNGVLNKQKEATYTPITPIILSIVALSSLIFCFILTRKAKSKSIDNEILPITGHTKKPPTNKEITLRFCALACILLTVGCSATNVVLGSRYGLPPWLATSMQNCRGCP